MGQLVDWRCVGQLVDEIEIETETETETEIVRLRLYEIQVHKKTNLTDVLYQET